MSLFQDPTGHKSENPSLGSPLIIVFRSEWPKALTSPRLIKAFWNSGRYVSSPDYFSTFSFVIQLIDVFCPNCLTVCRGSLVLRPSFCFPPLLFGFSVQFQMIGYAGIEREWVGRGKKSNFDTTKGPRNNCIMKSETGGAPALIYILIQDILFHQITRLFFLFLYSILHLTGQTLQLISLRKRTNTTVFTVANIMKFVQIYSFCLLFSSKNTKTYRAKKSWAVN